MSRPVDRAALFDVLPDACLVLTPDLVMVDANQACCALVERTLDQLVGHRVADVFSVNPQDPAAAERLTRAYRRALTAKVEIDVGVLRYDTPIDLVPLDGIVAYRPRYWSARVTPVLDADGEVELLLQRVREVTDAPADLVTTLGEGRGPATSETGGHDVAAAALAVAELATALSSELSQMREAMASRAVIEQAKGLLMGQRRCSDAEAFGLLKTLSQDSNRKLRDVCVALVADTAAPAL